MAKKKKKVKKAKKASKKSKKPTKKSKKKTNISTQKIQIQMQPVLVDNFVSLQKVMVNLATKFDTLNSQIKELLDLFELSAKSLAKKGFKLEPGKESDKKVMKKLDVLSEQNKIIARGMTLMHEATQASPPAPEPMPTLSVPSPVSPPLTTPKPPSFPKVPKQEEGEYKKSAPAPEKTEKKETSVEKK